MFDLNSTILVVDDMKTMRKLVQKACRDIGFTNFVEAEDGAFAWTALNAADSKISIIISDWNMPNASGLDLLKRVRSIEKTKSIPFFLLTAESEASQVKTAMVAGVDNYILKPFSTNSLKEKLEAVYKKRTAA
jgi:two-component system chemotaxis response regulator CheY